MTKKKKENLQTLFAVIGVIIGGSVDLRIPMAIICFQCVHLLSHE